MAVYYVHPNAGSNISGDGSEGNPFSSVYGGAAASSYGVGDTWLIARGTTHAPIDAAFTGNPANEAQRVMYGAYGSGAPPIINAEGSAYGVRVQNKNYVTVEDIDIYGATNVGLQVLNNSTRSCSYFHGRRVRAYNCAFGGVVMTHSVNSPSPAVGVVLDGCEGHDNGQHGVAIVAYATGAVLRNCRASNNSLSSSGWGVYHGGWGQTFIGTSGWAISGNVKSRALAVEPASVISGNTVGGAFFLAKNTGTPTTPGTGEWGYSAGTLYVNLGVIASGYAVAVIYQHNSGAVIERCTAWGHVNPDFDMVGIGVDRGVSGAVIRRCLSYDNGGSAFQCNQASDVLVESCEGRTSREVLMFSTMSGDNVVQNCEGVGVEYGLRFERLYSGDSITAQNNAVQGVTEDIYSAATVTGTVTASSNSYPGAVSGGADLGYIRDIRGFQSRKHIGAYGAARLRSVTA